MNNIVVLAILVPIFLPIVSILIILYFRARKYRKEAAQKHRDNLDRQKVDDIVEMATDQENTLLELNYSSQRDRVTNNKQNEYN